MFYGSRACAVKFSENRRGERVAVRGFYVDWRMKRRAGLKVMRILRR